MNSASERKHQTVHSDTIHELRQHWDPPALQPYILTPSGEAPSERVSFPRAMDWGYQLQVLNRKRIGGLRRAGKGRAARRVSLIGQETTGDQPGRAPTSRVPSARWALPDSPKASPGSPPRGSSRADPPLP